MKPLHILDLQIHDAMISRVSDSQSTNKNLRDENHLSDFSLRRRYLPHLVAYCDGPLAIHNEACAGLYEDTFSKPSIRHFSDSDHLT